jgi:predicted MPP superfamily phosphohydrolase
MGNRPAAALDPLSSGRIGEIHFLQKKTNFKELRWLKKPPLYSKVLPALDFFLAAFIGVLLVWLGHRIRPDLKPTWRAIEISGLFCFLADWGLLAALPILQRSFGQVGPSLLLISGLRWVFFTPAFFLLQRKPLKLYAIILLVVVVFVQAALFAFELDGFYIEPFRLTETELPVRAPAFLPDRPLRILQISDLHVERITQRERAMLVQAEILKPDIIVLTGDYTNSSYTNDPLTLHETRQVLSQLRAPDGIYAVNGNVDGPSTMSALFDGLANIRVLNNEVLPLPLPGGTIYFIGVTMSDSNGLDDQVLHTMVDSLPTNSYSILLYHTSELIETAASKNVNLYLSGHTHGGQVRLPFYGAIFTDTYYGKKYEMGEYTVGATTLYVSRGIGMGGGLLPRIRFLCPPEMVLLELGK